MRRFSRECGNPVLAQSIYSQAAEPEIGGDGRFREGPQRPAPHPKKPLAIAKGFGHKVRTLAVPDRMRV
jgi:hypothetical protein